MLAVRQGGVRVREIICISTLKRLKKRQLFAVSGLPILAAAID
jgi:hypothetical protein